MAERSIKPATYQDIIDLPEHLVGQIIDGELFVQPRPRPRHVHAESELQVELGNAFGRGRGGPGGWLILVEPELHLGQDILVPDLAGWRRERMASLPETAWFETAPDWVCEFVSPSTARYDRGPKRAIYAREKVKHIWYGDADARALEPFELRDGNYLLLHTYVDQDEVAAPPFDAVPFNLGNLWMD